MKKYIGTKMIEAERAFRIGDRIYSNENDEINAVLLAEGQIAVMGYLSLIHISEPTRP